MLAFGNRRPDTLGPILGPDGRNAVSCQELDLAHFWPRYMPRFVADGNQETPKWKPAGTWYLAGSNTCYHSYPREAGELGKSDPVVQTSNRRFRDDEFLISRSLTGGLSAIRVRLEFTPVEIPLLPHLPTGELVWSEMRYKAYSINS